ARAQIETEGSAHAFGLQTPAHIGGKFPAGTRVLLGALAKAPDDQFLAGDCTIGRQMNGRFGFSLKTLVETYLFYGLKKVSGKRAIQLPHDLARTLAFEKAQNERTRNNIRQRMAFELELHSISNLRKGPATGQATILAETAWSECAS